MPDPAKLKVGDPLPQREHTATAVSLFLYNAVIWNAHRIHYDEPYTTQVEKHPGVVIDGPLQGDWLAQIVTDWLGDDGQLISFEYSNRRASILGETLTAGGAISAIDGNEITLELAITNERGEITTPGGAVVRLD